jgi:hypothetical protein
MSEPNFKLILAVQLEIFGVLPPQNPFLAIRTWVKLAFFQFSDGHRSKNSSFVHPKKIKLNV